MAVPRTLTSRALCTLCIAAVAVLAACGTTATRPSPATVTKPNAPDARAQAANDIAAGVPVLPPAGSGRGGYYQDDGPGDKPPAGLQATPDAEVKIEAYAKSGNKPYVVFGKTYTPILDNREFTQRGVASWYGKKFHGQKTSSGELYDMYKMTAAHPTLPIPSYARVTNLVSGAQVIVRINDRGPFHSSRVIDLSYTAALKLGYLGKGSHEVQVERLLPAEIERMVAARRDGRTLPAPAFADLPAAPQLAARSVPVVGAVTAPSAKQLAVEAMLRSDMPLRLPGEPLPAAIIGRDGPQAGFSNDPANLAQAPAMSVALPVHAAAAGGQFYLQLGAYAQAANAESARALLAHDFSDLPPLEIVRQGTLVKVFSGPYASRADALDAAQRLQSASAWQARPKPLVVER